MRLIVLAANLGHDRELKMVPVLVGSPGLLVDVGANAYAPYSAAGVLARARVVAFEPVHEATTKLRSFYGEAIQVHQVALSDYIGDASMRVPVIEGVAVTTRAHVVEEPETPEGGSPASAIAVRTLDAYGMSGVTLIKIDVEGHELRVLTGARETLSQQRPSVIVEVEEKRTPGRLAEVAEFFRALEYSGYFWSKGGFVKIDEFRLDKHQDARRRGWNHEFINNFVWVPSELSLDRHLSGQRNRISRAFGWMRRWR